MIEKSCRMGVFLSKNRVPVHGLTVVFVVICVCIVCRKGLLMKMYPLFVAAALLGCCFWTADAQNSVFTYQGSLSLNGSSANGVYDLRFTVFDSLTAGNQIAGPRTNSAVSVSKGLFTVALDFGAGAFPGAARWIEVGGRTNGSF